MKKLFTVCSLLFMFAFANAQFTQTLKNLDIFNHLGVGVGVGTTGITVDLGTTITPWVQLRAGVDIMPKLKLNTSLDLEHMDQQYASSYPVPTLNEIDVQGKLSNTTGHFLFDIFPLTKWSSFHITVGGYFGGRSVIEAYNTNAYDELRDIYNFNHRLGQYSDPVYNNAGKIGVALGDYFIEPDASGNVNASIKVNSFRPYVGLGFGRMVPHSRINCLFDLGVQFWGHPQVWNDTNNQRLEESKLNDSDGGVIKIISKASVFPVLSIRLVGKIF